MLRSRCWLPAAVCCLTALCTVPAVCLANGPSVDPASLVVRVAQEVDPAADPSERATPSEPAEPPVPDEGAVMPAPTRNEPEPPTPPRRTRRGERAERLDLDSMLAYRAPITRLASVPNMFGDIFAGGSMISVCPPRPTSCTSSTLPPIGGGRRTKVAENNKALPMDRVFFNYNHFENALDTSVQPGYMRSHAVDRYTVGVEKTFRNGLCSLEIRQPFVGIHHADMPDLGFTGGEVGNLSIGVKRVLASCEHGLLAAGLGIEVPTGNRVKGRADRYDFQISNNAVYLAPWIGFLKTYGDDQWFCEGFLQMNLATNGNRVIYNDNSLGTLSEQNLLYFDLAVGYWLFTNPDALRLSGMALIAEYHYTTTVQDADTVTADDGFTTVEFGNPYNRLDISNATIGLHTVVGKTTIKVGAVFPLQNDSNRMFDAELQILVNRYF